MISNDSRLASMHLGVLLAGLVFVPGGARAAGAPAASSTVEKQIWQIDFEGGGRWRS